LVMIYVFSLLNYESIKLKIKRRGTIRNLGLRLPGYVPGAQEV